MDYTLNIVLPAKNRRATECQSWHSWRRGFRQLAILVVGDGATGATDRIAWEEGARVVAHPYSLVNNGTTVKTGARHATGEVLVLTDAGSQRHSASLDPVGVSVSEAEK